jgi:hypothetical protein
MLAAAIPARYSVKVSTMKKDNPKQRALPRNPLHAHPLLRKHAVHAKSRKAERRAERVRTVREPVDFSASIRAR